MDATNGTTPDSNTPSPPQKEKPGTVLQILPRLVTGGVERGTVDMAAALVDAGWNAIVVSAGGPMVREIERVGALHVSMPVHRKNVFIMRANIGRLCDVIRDHDVDLVHARSRAPAWSARAAAHRMKVPFVTTFHGTYGAGSFLKRQYNAVMTKGDKVIAISDFIAEHLTGVYGIDPQRVRTIYRGVDTSIFHPAAVSPERMIALAREWRLPDGVPVVMLPGRLTSWKGQEVLIDALAELGREDLRCMLVASDSGRKGYRERLEKQIARRNVGHVAQIVDDCRDMPAAFMLADVVISASTDPEAFGRVAAEAQALGKPVIATDHGGARETVADGETGWLVKPGDSGALAKYIEVALALTAKEREAIADHAIHRIQERFTREQMCDETLAVYAEVLSARA